MDARFASKIDGWLIPIMVLTVAGLVAALVAVMIEDTPWAIRILMAAVTVGVAVLLFAVFKHTYYVVDDDILRIVSGPFRWKIPVANIVEITPSRNPLSSPALSLDRLKIRCGKSKFILVSPDDKAGFIRTIEQAQREADG